MSHALSETSSSPDLAIYGLSTVPYDCYAYLGKIRTWGSGGSVQSLNRLGSKRDSLELQFPALSPVESGGRTVEPVLMYSRDDVYVCGPASSSIRLVTWHIAGVETVLIGCHYDLCSFLCRADRLTSLRNGMYYSQPCV